MQCPRADRPWATARCGREWSRLSVQFLSWIPNLDGRPSFPILKSPCYPQPHSIVERTSRGMSARIHPARTAALALFLLTSLNLFNFIDRYVLPGVQPLIQREFHINDAQTGLLTSAFFFTYMLIAPATGWLGD